MAVKQRRSGGLRLVSLPCLLALALVACGGGASEPDAGSGNTETTTQANIPTDEDLAAFCGEMGRLAGERPAEYVGSAEHVDDIERLDDVAPSEIRVDVETYREFIASGAVNADDPDSQLSENWPSEVQDAVSRIRAYEATNC